MTRTLILISPVYVAFFWMLVLVLHSKKSNGPKVFLGEFMLVAFLLYLSHFFFFNHEFRIYLFFDPLYTATSLAVYPMYYIYVRLLTRDRTFSFMLHFRYLLIPVFFYLLSIAGYLSLNEPKRFEYVTRVLTGYDNPQGEFMVPYIIYLAGRIVFIIQVVVYMALVNRLLRKYRIRIGNYYSDLRGRSLRWVSVMNILYFIASVSSIALAIFGREEFLDNNVKLLFPSLVFSSLLFIIGYLGNRQKTPEPERKETKIADAELSENAKVNLEDRLRYLFETDRVYLIKDLKITDVCNRLGTNRTYVSNIINKRFKMNFVSFVNQYRFRHAKNLLDSDPSITVEELTEKSGFGSVNSVYRSFQVYERISLTRYRKMLESQSRGVKR